MPDLIYSHARGHVLFDENVVERLQKHRQTTGTSESGGLLLGFRRSPHLHVTACTEPYTGDRCSIFSFYRRDKLHQNRAIQFWSSTQETGYYLGEWHTHPTAVPKPSITDLSQWSELMNSPLGIDLLFLIVGQTHWYLQRGNHVF